MVESDAWADTMASHLETIQWRVRPPGIVDGPKLGPELPVCLDQISEPEVKAAIANLKRGRACGPDAFPAEYWHVLVDDLAILKWLTALFNKCWDEGRVPHDWELAYVVALHNKGRVDDFESHRPISLISVVYKAFTSLVLRRILKSGAEARFTKSQFGFRSGRGTNDAVYVARRHLELAWAHRGGSVAMLALDWSKAFDSINTECLLIALQRFGLPQKLVDLIAGVYSNRRFQVRDGMQLSSERNQRS